jgi:hypothetical protein
MPDTTYIDLAATNHNMLAYCLVVVGQYADAARHVIQSLHISTELTNAAVHYLLTVLDELAGVLGINLDINQPNEITGALDINRPNGITGVLDVNQPNRCVEFLTDTGSSWRSSTC